MYGSANANTTQPRCFESYITHLLYRAFLFIALIRLNHAELSDVYGKQITVHAVRSIASDLLDELVARRFRMCLCVRSAETSGAS